MFDRLFTRANAVERHRRAPFLEWRLRYLASCAQQGTSLSTLRRSAQYLLLFVDSLDLGGEGLIHPQQIEQAADRWASRQPPHHLLKDPQASRDRFIAVARGWLRFLGRLHESAPVPQPYAHLIAEFADYMRVERGLSPLTIHTRIGRVEEFLGQLLEQGCAVRNMTIQHIDEAIALKGREGCKRSSVQTYAFVLRSFVRYAELRGWCRGLAAAILPPRVYKGESLPAGPAWEDVQRMLAGTGTDHPTAIRDRAILMLFAVYGLRAGEVRRLRLDDLDWEKETIRVVRSKQQRRVSLYPLSHVVGQAILRYVKDVRPCGGCREVFLTARAPFRAIRNSALWQVVSRRMQAIGIQTSHHGPHVLRHACATRLLASGVSMKEIGDHLGHGSSAATSVYAKVDIARLREVADFSLEGLR